MEKLFYTSLAILLVISAVVAEVEISPRVGKTCYKCTGIECSREAAKNQTTTCTDILDQCVTVFEGQTIVARGCYAELPDEFRLKCENSFLGLDCEKCSSILCNKYSHSDVRCAQCDSSMDQSCLQSPSVSRCPFTPTYGAFCYIQYSANKTVRGCSPSLRSQIDCMGNANCLLCGEAGCNTIAFPLGRRYCYACSGEYCSTLSASLTLCNKLDDQCVSLRSGEDVVKGCLGDLSEAQRSSCTGNTCLKCTGSACNTEDPVEKKNSAITARISFSVMILILVSLRFY